MHPIVVKPVNSQFVVIWVTLMLRRGHQLSEFEPGLNGDNLVLQNTNMINTLKTDFNTFRQSGLTMAEYFGHNVIIAKRQHGEKFNIDRNVQLTYDQVIL